MRFARVEGLRLEPIGPAWATWSPASGETHVLNDEAASVLEVLADEGPLSTIELACTLARDIGLTPAQIEPGIQVALLALEHAGFVLRLDNPGL